MTSPASTQPLPIEPLLPQIADQVREAGMLILQAEPGAGKTTRVPVVLLEDLGDQGEVWVLEPRRLAARLAAGWVASAMGQAPGELVGWQVRHDTRAGPRTRLRYVTEGILAARLASDPDLRGIGVVVLDEFHERHLDGDLALAMVVHLRATRRPDLRLVVMSATLDCGPLARLLEAPVMEIPGRVHPVEISWATRPDPAPVEEQVAQALSSLTREGQPPPGAVLVFLPGAAEIRRTLRACRRLAEDRGLDLAVLHGALPPDEQHRALAASERTKVILATNVAESSVTVPGVRVVIDAGLERVASDSPWSGIRSLETRPISRASATQRAGRAGRLGPGRCLRLYTRRDHDSRPERADPEIGRLDLAPLVLSLRAAGVEDVASLAWLDAPPETALHSAELLLRRLGALDADGALTPIGQRMQRLPLPPRLARVVVAATQRGIATMGCEAAAVLDQRDLRRDTRPGLRGEPVASRGRGREGSSDVLELIDCYHQARQRRFAAGPLRSLDIDADAARAVHLASQQLQRITKRWQATETSPEDAEESLLQSLLVGFVDRVAQRNKPHSEALALADGGRVRLGRHSVVTTAPWLVALDTGAQGGGRGGPLVRLASAIEPDWLIDFEDVREERVVRWDAARERVEASERLCFGKLVLDDRRLPTPTGPAVEAALRKAALAAGVSAFDPEGKASHWLGRLAFARTLDPELPEVSADALEEALGAACANKHSFAELRAEGLVAAVQARLLPKQLGTLKHLAPETVTLPGGRRLAVHYDPGRDPWVESWLQDFFGMSTGPSIGNSRTPLVLHLLAPNRRAVQVTADLPGFWQREYPKVRRELSRRYPRHQWPEDPLGARPPPPGGRRKRR